MGEESSIVLATNPQHQSQSQAHSHHFHIFSHCDAPWHQHNHLLFWRHVGECPQNLYDTRLSDPEQAQAGIDDPTTQLEINIILTSWTLVVSLAGAWFADTLGRKTLCSISLAGQIITFYILAGLTAIYGESDNKSGIYGTLAFIFLYNASYAYGITPLTVLYPPEVLSLECRAIGMSIYTLTTKLSGLLVTMAFPFSMAAIGWKTYIINASADVLMLVGVVWYWVETRGLTLEEVDKVFEGEKHSDVPDLKAVLDGEVEVGSGFLKKEITVPSNQEVVVTKE